MANRRVDAERDRLVLDHMHLTKVSLRRFRRWRVDFDDLRAEATVALIHAAAEFDPTRGVPFAAYAMTAMRRRMLFYCLKNHGAAELPQYTLQHIREAARAEARLRREGGLTENEIEAAAAKETRCSVERLRRLRFLLQATTQELDAPLGDGPTGTKTTLLDMLVDPEDGPEAIAQRRVDHQKLQAAIDSYLAGQSPRVAQIMRERTLADEPRRLSEMSAELGIVSQRINQIEIKARGALQRAMKNVFDTRLPAHG